jgi:hypothetical protein
MSSSSLAKKRRRRAAGRAGYYLIDLNPKQATERLGEPTKPWELE